MYDADIFSSRQAAEELVRLGIVEKLPEHSTMCRWLRQGRFAGARKLGRGPSSPWLIPESAIIAFRPPKLGPPFRIRESECGCVLPTQSCPVCRAAARQAAGPLEEIY